MIKTRYKLFVVCPSDDLIIVIAAHHRTKDTLRQAFALAQAFVTDGQILGAEAWDIQKKERLADKYNTSKKLKSQIRRSIDQPINNTKAKGDKDEFQQVNSGRKPRKRSRT